jgi:hypothetical protein
MTTALSFFLGVCPGPGTGGLGGLAGTRRRVNFCHPRSVPHSVDIISAASNRTSMKLATFLTALLLPLTAWAQMRLLPTAAWAQPLPVPRVGGPGGGCPVGYSWQGSYCVPLGASSRSPPRDPKTAEGCLPLGMGCVRFVPRENIKPDQTNNRNSPSAPLVALGRQGPGHPPPLSAGGPGRRPRLPLGPSFRLHAR